MNSKFTIATLALALLAGTAPTAFAQDKPVAFAVENSFASLDTYDTNVTLDLSVCKSLYQGLHTFDKNLRVVPRLADS